jgi:hypothetical protein
MDKRIAGSVAAGGLLAAAVLLLYFGQARVSPVGPGDPAPAVWSGVDESRFLIGWTVGATDCLACDAPVYELRQLKSRFGGKLLVSVVAVDADSAIVGPFIRRERLDAAVTYIPRSVYRDQFGNAPLPALYLVSRDSIVASELTVKGSGTAERGKRRFFDGAIERLVE